MICKLLDLQAGHFKLNHVEIKPDALTLILESPCKRCRCPLCHKFSYNVHSKYHRHLKDLPCFAYKASIHLIVHKYYCRNLLCPQKIFTERFTEGIAPYQRMTDRLCSLLSSLTLHLSSHGAERLCCQQLHIEVSDTTLARLLQRQSLAEPSTPKVLGVDDWAVKKRGHYGTILVDREIKVLYQKGMPLKAIARNLCISRNTVKKYLHLKEPPCRRPYCKVNIALYDRYIRKRLKEVPDIKLRQLYQEIKQRGYNGCRSTAM